MELVELIMEQDKRVYVGYTADNKLVTFRPEGRCLIVNNESVLVVSVAEDPDGSSVIVEY